MESSIKRSLLRIGGMSCTGCQAKIEQELRSLPGIRSAAVSYSSGMADVTYDPRRISPKAITAAVEKLGYQVLSGGQREETGVGRVAAFLTLIAALYVLLQRSGILNLLAPGRLADTGTGYGMLFVIGLITSVHCIAMCGGINLSQCLPRENVPNPAEQVHSAGRTPPALAPALLYNLGRVISYTAIGFLLGLVGMLFGGGSDTGLPAVVQGILKLAAGGFMVLMGLNLLNLFPRLRALQPRIPAALSRRVSAGRSRSRSPLIVGLLNGLMPCGPLQSMQIVALASGSPFTGALSMLLFSLGTVPLMLGFGSLVSALGKRFSHRVTSVGGVLVVVMGLSMLSQGGSLTGLLSPGLLLAVIVGLCAVGIAASLPFRKRSYRTISTAAAAVLTIAAIGAWNVRAAGTVPGSPGAVKIVDGRQVVTSTLSSGSYPDITVQSGTPVEWTIHAPQGSINGCNNKLNIQEYGISNYTLQAGDNVIEFTPMKAGNYSYSCWMGMIHGTITVTEASASSGGTSGNFASSSSGSSGVSAPTPAGYRIPTDSVAVARETTYQGDPVQEITIALTDQGFRPAVAVVKSGLPVLWTIQNTASGAEKATQLLVPDYAAELPIGKGDNSLSFEPSASFDFSTADHAFYGYVKVVDDLKTADLAAIKAEAGSFKTLIWPPETFRGGAAAEGGSTGGAAKATVKDGVQYVTSTVSSGGYQPIRVQQGIPVKWTLNAPEGSLNSCNQSIVIPEFNLRTDLKTGDNLIEFTPDRSGTFAFSCWMGMVRSSITVVGKDGSVAPTQNDGSDQLPSCCG